MKVRNCGIDHLSAQNLPHPLRMAKFKISMHHYCILHLPYYLEHSLCTSVQAHTAFLRLIYPSVFVPQLTFSQEHIEASNTTLCNDVAATIPCHDVTNIISLNNTKIIMCAPNHNQKQSLINKGIQAFYYRNNHISSARYIHYVKLGYSNIYMLRLNGVFSIVFYL